MKFTQSTLDNQPLMTVGTLRVTAELESPGRSPITLTMFQGGAFPSAMTPEILIRVVGDAIASWAATCKPIQSTWNKNTAQGSSNNSTKIKGKLSKTFRMKKE